tara:strand:+ start:15537 stop:16046 length:510 start_codon:yes stop_codon:yes gene_type:complete
MSGTLYQMKDEYLDLLRLIDEELEIGEDADQSVIKALESTQGDIKEKIDNVCKIIAELEAKAHARRVHAEKFESRAMHAESHARRLKQYLHITMQGLEWTHFESEEFTLRVCGNGGKKSLTFLDDVPDEYKITRTEQVADMDKIRKELEAGEELAFAELQDRGTHLRIR